jgi:hypothetical protein
MLPHSRTEEVSHDGDGIPAHNPRHEQNGRNIQPLNTQDACDDTAPPPSYTVAQENDAISSLSPNNAPSRSVYMDATFANLQLDNKPHKADANQCLAHLKLLFAFHNMKEDIGYNDGIWGLWNTRANAEPTPPVDSKGLETSNCSSERDPSKTDEQKQALLSHVREKWWAVFVARAVDRYSAWWNTLTRNLSLTESAIEKCASPTYGKFPESGGSSYWTQSMLPPLGMYQKLYLLMEVVEQTARMCSQSC